MENSKEKTKAHLIEKSIADLKARSEREKEDSLISLIIEIIVSSTLKQYYETSDKIPEVQPARTE